jgi:hypothetical protein
LENRHKADKELENKAEGTLFSKDASIGERLAALGTAIMMNKKVAGGINKHMVIYCNKCHLLIEIVYYSFIVEVVRCVKILKHKMSL